MEAFLAFAGVEDPPEIPAVLPLPPLEPLAARLGPEYEAAMVAYRGPTSRTNWILPGRILCGEKPHSALTELCAAGVTTFVSLQQKNESDPYRDGVNKKLGAAAKFMTLPIPDQKTTTDAHLTALVLEIIERVGDGEVMYVHCRGGHGRTGTVCSLLLGLCHGLDGPTALATYQALHDLRQQPCFAAHSYEPSPDGASCIALFPVQHAQVIRLLGGIHEAEVGTAVDVSDAPPAVHKGLSGAYGHGASKYTEGVLADWKAHGEAASAAAKRKDWSTAAAEFELCVSLRPDWEKGQHCLAKAKAKVDATGQPVSQAAPGGEGGDAEAGHSDSVPSGSGSASATAPVAAPPPKQPLGAHVPHFVVLVGLPGAGKTTFSKALARSSDQWDVIDSDEAGGKRATDEAIANACRRLTKQGAGTPGSHIVVDRCHVKLADRAELLDAALGLLPEKYAVRAGGKARATANVVAVYFATDAAICTERVASRTDHPSIPYGHGRSAVASMNKALALPDAVVTSAAAGDDDGSKNGVIAEGMRWLVVRTAADTDALLASWGARPAAPAPMGFFKFPRTHHVLNTGGTAVTRDDLVMPLSESAPFFDGKTIIVADEKVDGANLGLSLTKDYEIRAQNRSHFVNPKTHAQFKPLAHWIEEHGWAICQLLEPEVEVLFGEWCVAQHSRPYSRLPGYFIAFDIYSKRTGTFASATERARRLAGLDIPVVRTLARRAFHSAEDLLSLLEMKSVYSDGFVEGAYLRIDKGDGDGDENARRGKIVRPDFIQGMNEGEHWQQGEFVKNVIRPDLWVDA